MAGATFSRIKNWTPETLTNTDLNAEIDNILNNLNAPGLDDYSTNVAQMQLQTSPGTVGDEALATSLAGEIERIRYMISQMIGGTYWYSALPTTLTELNSALGGGLDSNRISSGKISSLSSQPIFLDPAGTAGGLICAVDANPTALVYYVNGTAVTVSTDTNITGLLAAPSSNNTALVNDTRLADQDWSKYLGENGTSIPIDTIGSEISALVGKYAAFSITNGVDTEYFLALVESDKLSDARRGYFFNSSQASVPRIAFSDNDTITLLKLTWIFGKDDGTFVVVYTNPTVDFDEPSSPNTGDYWFDLTNDIWKTFNSTTWVDAEASLLGITAQTTADCVGARAFDLFKNHHGLNTLKLTKSTASTVIANKGCETVVYGSTLRYKQGFPTWDMANDLVSGLTEAADTTYYFYLDENGQPYIDTVAPHDRRSDLKGFYHPAETWRCFGQAWNDASSNLTRAFDIEDESETAYMITNTVGSSALTARFHAPLAARFKFKNATTATGEPVMSGVLPAMDMTIDSTATLDHADATEDHFFWYLVSGANYVDFGVSSALYDRTLIQTTAAMAAAEATRDIYTEVALTDRPVKVVADSLSTQTTAGTYAATLTAINLGFAFEWEYFKRAGDSGTETDISASMQSVANQSTAFYATGQYPIEVICLPFDTGISYFEISLDTAANNATGDFQITSGGTILTLMRLDYRGETGTSTNNMKVGLNNLCAREAAPAKGSITYNLQQAANSSDDNVTTANCSLLIREVR